MYRVTYTQGNGYRCGCCRNTWEGSQDFKTEKEVIDFLVRKEYVRRNPKESEWEDEDDWTLEEVREVKDDDLTDKFSDMVDILVDNKDNKRESSFFVYLLTGSSIFTILRDNVIMSISTLFKL